MEDDLFSGFFNNKKKTDVNPEKTTDHYQIDPERQKDLDLATMMHSDFVKKHKGKLIKRKDCDCGARGCGGDVETNIHADCLCDGASNRKMCFCEEIHCEIKCLVKNN